MNVYFIPGMGADDRLFRNVLLPDGFEAHCLNWIPQHADETIPGYAARLAGGIDAARPFILIGVSLGGIMAVEIAKIYKPAATIIIGSIPLSTHLPGYYHVLGSRLGLLKVLPGGLFKQAATFKRHFTREKGTDKQLIRQMIAEADGAFLIWAMKAVLRWKNDEAPERLIHIHGSRDIVFPIGMTRPSHRIKRGGHLIVMSHAQEVNEILRGVMTAI